jgi:hypothetical protein
MVKIGSSGPFGNTERAPDLTVGEAFNVMQDDHGALAVSEVCERLLEPLAQLARLRGIAEGESDVVWQLIGVADLPSAHQIERRIRHDPVQPRPEWLVGAKPVERAVGVEESLLHRVFRVLVREHDSADDAVGTALVQPDERREGVVRPTLRRDDYGTLRRRTVSVNRSEH